MSLKRRRHDDEMVKEEAATAASDSGLEDVYWMQDDGHEQLEDDGYGYADAAPKMEEEEAVDDSWDADASWGDGRQSGGNLGYQNGSGSYDGAGAQVQKGHKGYQQGGNHGFQRGGNQGFQQGYKGYKGYKNNSGNNKSSWNSWNKQWKKPKYEPKQEHEKSSSSKGHYVDGGWVSASGEFFERLRL